jgi:hypothetical protein
MTFLLVHRILVINKKDVSILLSLMMIITLVPLILVIKSLEIFINPLHVVMDLLALKINAINLLDVPILLSLVMIITNVQLIIVTLTADVPIFL